MQFALISCHRKLGTRTKSDWINLFAICTMFILTTSFVTVSVVECWAGFEVHDPYDATSSDLYLVGPWFQDVVFAVSVRTLPENPRCGLYIY